MEIVCDLRLSLKAWAPCVLIYGKPNDWKCHSLSFLENGSGDEFRPEAAGETQDSLALSSAA